MPKFEVKVTAQDIEDGAGFAGEFNKCPVVCALQRMGCEQIDADEDRILLTFKKNRFLFKTPRVANHFIGDFDYGREVQPIEFILEKPNLATIEDERPSLITDAGENFD